MLESPEIRLGCGQAPIEETVDGLGRAKKTVDAVVYKLSDKAILKAIIEKAKDGVRIRLLINHELARKKKRWIKALRNEPGVEIRIWGKRRGKLHAKFTIIDGTLALCGSYNWTQRGGRRKNKVEIMQTFTEETQVAQFTTLFEEIWGDEKRT